MTRLLLIITALVLLLLPLACRTPEDTSNNERDPEESKITTFQSRWVMGDEPRKVVNFSGSVSGHVAGEESEFLLRLENQSPTDAWLDGYCVFLGNQEGVILEIAQEDFGVQPHSQTERIIRVAFPEDLDGPYGLYLLIPERGSNVQTIWIGDRQAIQLPAWPLLETCP